MAKELTLPTEHVDVVNLYNLEEALPDGLHDAQQKIELESRDLSESQCAINSSPTQTPADEGEV